MAPNLVGRPDQRNGEIIELGCVICIDRYCCGRGWLTAVDLSSGLAWQASKYGVLRGGTPVAVASLRTKTPNSRR